MWFLHQIKRKIQFLALKTTQNLFFHVGNHIKCALLRILHQTQNFSQKHKFPLDFRQILNRAHLHFFHIFSLKTSFFIDFSGFKPIFHSKNSIFQSFIHCNAGISRSASFAIGYLMKTQKMTYREAFNKCRETRSKSVGVSENPDVQNVKISEFKLLKVRFLKFFDEKSLKYWLF